METRLSQLEVRVDPARAVHWPEGGGYQPAELLIDGESLLELVRAVELPFALAEFEERRAERLSNGERADDLYVMAGDYLNPPVNSILLPCRTLLDKPWQPFDHGTPGKTMFFGCSCGIVECWYLLGRITLSPEVVVWHEFEQPQRGETWDYTRLGPFVFDRMQYETALRVSPLARPKHAEPNAAAVTAAIG